jgi:exodeoxyribonuclease V alpha subunit
LFEATQDGHCALPGVKLVAKAMELLEIAERVVEQALSQMMTKGDVILEQIGTEDLIFMPHLERAQREIAQRIVKLSKSGSGFPAIDFERAVG